MSKIEYELRLRAGIYGADGRPGGGARTGVVAGRYPSVDEDGAAGAV